MRKGFLMGMAGAALMVALSGCGTSTTQVVIKDPKYPKNDCFSSNLRVLHSPLKVRYDSYKYNCPGYAHDVCNDIGPCYGGCN